MAATVNTYVAALTARDPARACAQLLPAARRSVKAYQENFHSAALWIRCGERAFFHPVEADAVLHDGRAVSIEIVDGGPGPLDSGWPAAHRLAEALVPDGPDTATRFSLMQVGGRWTIFMIDFIGCSGAT